MGLLGSRRAVLEKEPPGDEVQKEAVTEIWQIKSTVHFGPQTGPSQLLCAQTSEGLRYEAISEQLMGGGGQALRLTGANPNKPVSYRQCAKMPVAQTTLARYWVIFRQPPAFDWMTAPLPGYRESRPTCPAPYPSP